MSSSRQLKRSSPGSWGGVYVSPPADPHFFNALNQLLSGVARLFSLRSCLLARPNNLDASFPSSHQFELLSTYIVSYFRSSNADCPSAPPASSGQNFSSAILPASTKHPHLRLLAELPSRPHSPDIVRSDISDNSARLHFSWLRIHSSSFPSTPSLFSANLHPRPQTCAALDKTARHDYPGPGRDSSPREFLALRSRPQLYPFAT